MTWLLKKPPGKVRDAGLRKHVIPTMAKRAKAWDLCFLRPSFIVFA